MLNDGRPFTSKFPSKFGGSHSTFAHCGSALPKQNHAAYECWSNSWCPVCVFCSACQQKMRCAAHPELAYPIKFRCLGPEQRFDPKPPPWLDIGLEDKTITSCLTTIVVFL